MQKVVLEGAPAALKKGVDLVADAVKSTAGPKGRNVIIHKNFGISEITNDGVTVARSIDQGHDPVINMGVTLVQEACSDTEAMAGDGTTAAAVLLQAMVAKGLKAAQVGSNVISLKRGMEKATHSIVKALDEMRLPIEEGDDYVKKVATISTNNDPVLGKILQEAFLEVGNDGIISLEDGVQPETQLLVSEGLKLSRGWRSQYFMTEDKPPQAVHNNPYILVTDANITNSEALINIYTKVSAKDKALIVISDGVGDMAMQNIIMSNLQGKVKLPMIKTPGFGDYRVQMCEDLCAAIGATFVSTASGFKLEDLELEHLGQAKRVVINAETTTIVGGKADKEKVDARIDVIKGELSVKDIDQYDQGILEERLAILSGKVAIIKVGALSESELKEKRRRLDDALAATRAAISEGIVPGGGMALLIAQSSVEGIPYEDEDEKLGIDVVMDSLRAPFDTILRNGGYEPGQVMAQLGAKGPGYGLNVKTGEYVNMLEDGVVDPVKVIKSSLLNANSVASMLLTTDVLICNEKEEI